MAEKGKYLCPHCSSELPAGQSRFMESVFCVNCGLVRFDGSKPQPNKDAIRREMKAYTLIFGYLWQLGGIEAIKRFGEYWAEEAARGRKPFLKDQPPSVLGLLERDIEWEWLGRECERLDENAYVGYLPQCPLRERMNAFARKVGAPKDFVCEIFCSLIYDRTYALLGYESQREILPDGGCRVTIHLGS